MFTSMIWSVLSRRNLINKEFWNEEVEKSCNVGEELTHIGFVEFQYRSGNIRPSLLETEKCYYERLPSKQLNATAQCPHLHQQQLSPPNALYQPHIYFCP